MMAREYAQGFYSSFFEYSMDAVLLTAPEGAILAANPAACLLFGRTEEEICRAGRSGVVDESSPNLQRMLEERARTGKTRGELVLVRGDGTRFPAEVSSVQFPDADGQARTVMIIRDLSQLKASEQAQAKLLIEINRNAAEIEAILAAQEDAVLTYDMALNVRRANPSFMRAYGFDPVGHNARDLMKHLSGGYLDGRPLALDELPTPRALRGERVSHELYQVTRGDGSLAIIEASARPLYVGGSIVGTVAVWHDITELKRAEDALKKSAQEIEDLYNNAPCGYHSLDRDGTVVRINETELLWLGYTRDELLGKVKWEDLVTPESRKTFREKFPVFIKQGYINDLEFEVVRKNGTHFRGVVNATAIFDADGGYLMSRSTLFDISERKAMEEQMRRMANYDALTDLPNRVLVFDRLKQALAVDKRSHVHAALLYLDLDQFKPINDTLGHGAGDMLLKEAARRMRECIRESDTVGRIGGDEFVVVLPVAETQHDVMRVAEKIRHALHRQFVLAGRTLNISSSIGVALYPEHGENEATLVKNADTAMYYSKESGGNTVTLYRPGMLSRET